MPPALVSSSFTVIYKMPGMVMFAVILAIWEMEIGRSGFKASLGGKKLVRPYVKN
jgi:hypothetical protein